MKGAGALQSRALRRRGKSRLSLPLLGFLLRTRLRFRFFLGRFLCLLGFFLRSFFGGLGFRARRRGWRGRLAQRNFLGLFFDDDDLFGFFLDYVVAAPAGFVVVFLVPRQILAVVIVHLRVRHGSPPWGSPFPDALPYPSRL